MIGGYIFDAGSGGYNDVMITFVTLTLVTMVAATLVPIGKDEEAFQEPDEPRWVFLFLYAVSCFLCGLPGCVHIENGVSRGTLLRQVFENPVCYANVLVRKTKTS